MILIRTHSHAHELVFMPIAMDLGGGGETDSRALTCAQTVFSQTDISIHSQVRHMRHAAEVRHALHKLSPIHFVVAQYDLCCYKLIIAVASTYTANPATQTNASTYTQTYTYT